MARGLNRVELIGNLGADPELRYTQGGTPVANFNIACTETWTKDGQRQEQTEWVRIVAWRNLAEIAAAHLSKGKQIYCAGKMVTRDWTDRDGVERKSVEVHIRDMIMLGSGSGQTDLGDPNVDRPHPEPGTQDAGVTDDDIPF